MTLLHIILSTEIVFFTYFILINLIYLFLNIVATKNILRYQKITKLNIFPETYSGIEPSISILMPAYNEEGGITTSTRSVLQLTYSIYEVIVINDGSSDETLSVLIRDFSLTPFPESFSHSLPTQKVRAVYRSKIYPNLKVIDKENGGKADALNAGINLSSFPLICSLDADSILQRNSLQLVVKPFLEDSRTIASGGIVRILNGSEVKEGYLLKTALPFNLLVNFQVVEYLRAFFFGRLGWSPLNALMVISGAFGLFKKEAVIEAGGYLVGTVGEDMELVVRLHKIFRFSHKPYWIYYVPDPICWTEAPEDLGNLKKQRLSWQRGISESLIKNMKLLFYPRGGIVSWFAFPYLILFEWLGPLIETAGYVITLLAFVYGYLSFRALIAFYIAAYGLGCILSVSTLLLEELAYPVYSGIKNMILLTIAALLENLGYRQLNSFWRLQGIIKWILFPHAKRVQLKRSSAREKNKQLS